MISKHDAERHLKELDRRMMTRLDTKFSARESNRYFGRAATGSTRIINPGSCEKSHRWAMVAMVI